MCHAVCKYVEPSIQNLKQCAPGFPYATEAAIQCLKHPAGSPDVRRIILQK